MRNNQLIATCQQPVPSKKLEKGRDYGHNESETICLMRQTKSISTKSQCSLDMKNSLRAPLVDYVQCCISSKIHQTKIKYYCVVRMNTFLLQIIYLITSQITTKSSYFDTSVAHTDLGITQIFMKLWRNLFQHLDVLKPLFKQILENYMFDLTRCYKNQCSHTLHNFHFSNLKE